jgi:Na+-translocating ferredoxin:NAD+ oxidoreductase RNF subunit RnfB
MTKRVNRLDEALLRDIAEYRRTQTRRPGGNPIAQLRTIPIGRSLAPDLTVMSYERIEELVKDKDRVAVTACICRQAAKMTGAGCAAPEETCLSFGAFADYYVQTGLGRAINGAELAAILKSAERANLVLQPSNSKDISFLCCCCGCCCGALKAFQAHPKPASAVTSPFTANLVPEECNGCEVCLARCQMQALAAGEDRVVLNAKRCIGCGLCVSVCPTGALSLVRKPETPRGVPPVTFDDTWRTILQAQVPAR